MKKMVNKLISCVCVIAMSISMATIPAHADEEIKVILDGEKINFDVAPQIMDDYTMVPMRAIFEALGYTVEWDQENQGITAMNLQTDKMIALIIDEPYMLYSQLSEMFFLGAYDTYIKDKTVPLDKAPAIVNERTLVPVRAISEASGCNVEWDGDTRTVIITSGTPEQNDYSGNYNKLKNKLIEDGTYDEDDNVYELKAQISSDPNGIFKATYLVDMDMVAISAGYKGEHLLLSMLLLMDKGVHSASVNFGGNEPDAINMTGYFRKDTHKFVILESNGNDAVNEEFINYLNESLKIMDTFCSIVDSELTLSGLGVNYK